MKIILLDKIQRLGEIGDIVEVNSGYARNFLIPQKKAAFASDKNIKEVEAKKDELAYLSLMGCSVPVGISTIEKIVKPKKKRKYIINWFRSNRFSYSTLL